MAFDNSPFEVAWLYVYCTELTKCSAQVMRDAFEQLKQLFKVPIEV
jgi:hypothetical protein